MYLPSEHERMLAPPRKGDRKGLSKARFRVLNMDKLEVRKREGYGQIAYYAYMAIKVESKDERQEYQKKIGIALCVLDGIGLLDKGDFILLQDMRYSDLESCFDYVNKKAGCWYEL